MSVRDGGPVYPIFMPGADSSTWLETRGMSLRDYFAAAALTGILAAAVAEEQESIAAECYELADALLAAREKDTTP